MIFSKFVSTVFLQSFHVETFGNTFFTRFFKIFLTKDSKYDYNDTILNRIDYILRKFRRFNIPFPRGNAILKP